MIGWPSDAWLWLVDHTVPEYDWSIILCLIVIGKPSMIVCDWLTVVFFLMIGWPFHAWLWSDDYPVPEYDWSLIPCLAVTGSTILCLTVNGRPPDARLWSANHPVLDRDSRALRSLLCFTFPRSTTTGTLSRQQLRDNHRCRFLCGVVSMVVDICRCWDYSYCCSFWWC